MALKSHHRFKVPSHKTLEPSPFCTIPLSSTHSTPFPYPFQFDALHQNIHPV